MSPVAARGNRPSNACARHAPMAGPTFDRVAAFQKIVAQDAVRRETPLECAVERVDDVNALADERAFVEDVLIRVRDRARVLVDPWLASVQALPTSGVDRAMSAMTRTRLFGSRSAVSIIRSAHSLARSRSSLPAATRTPTRRRFSIKASRSMIGMAQLAELQRGHRLVGGDEAAQAISVDASIAVRDSLERDVVHARQAR
jgi:hypothetical protein